MTSYILAILFFALKPKFIIKIVIFNTFALSEALSEKYQSPEVASNKLEERPHRDYETAFCLPRAFMLLEKKIF
jgi:hypothetical protein